jgi:SNF2 family DNA or RNA helicase
MQDLLEREDIETLKQLTAAEKASDTSDRGRQIVSICTQLAAMIKKTRDSPSQNDDPVRRAPVRSNTRGSSSLEIDEDLEELDDLEDETFNSDANLTTGQQFGMKYDFDQYLGTLMDGKQWEAVKAKAKCSKCRQTPNIPWLTACRHIYCQACLEELQLKAATDGKERAICCHCASMFSYSMPCEDEDDDGSQNEPLDISDDDYSNRRKGKEKKSAKRARTDRETIRDDWIDMPGTVLPSAKTLAIKAQILNWLHEAPDTKIIIYTQFLAMIRILARICQHECWSYCEYHGSMSLMARTNTIKTFAEDPSKKVLLASLKCGGLGLNLTMASRVIVVDPWWNHAIEQQAFCRVFRYGQVAQTYMTRFCVRNTVDEKLINMQERKTAEIDEVMEDNGKTMKKLSMGDLLRLFGPVREMDDGTPFIMPDEEEATGCVDPEYGDEDE